MSVEETKRTRESVIDSVDNDTMLYREIGLRIKNEREALGFTQIDLAAEIGLTRTSVVNIESGRQRLPIHVLYSIASAMGISVHILLPNNPLNTFL